MNQITECKRKKGQQHSVKNLMPSARTKVFININNSIVANSLDNRNNPIFFRIGLCCLLVISHLRENGLDIEK